MRVVCATNKDLQALITEQKFREDLYFRISEVTINVPPLRERRGGPTVLAHALLRKFNGAQGRPKRGFTEDAIAALEAYRWPGNVRELENKVKSAMIMAEGALLTAEDLGLQGGGRRRAAVQSQGSAHARRAPGDPAGARDLRQATCRAPPSCSA